ncbi:hypothetical protein ACQ5SK_18600 [Bradyrhizobium japonicum]
MGYSQKLRLKGTIPKNAVIGGLATMNYDRHAQEVRQAREAALEEARRQEEKCDAEAVPDWLGDAQKTSDIAATLMMLPFVELTKNYAAAQIDLGRVYQGYPLGGDNALIPKAREEVLEALHIGGDAAKFLRDPLNETTEWAEQSAREAARLAEDTARALEDAAKLAEDAGRAAAEAVNAEKKRLEEAMNAERKQLEDAARAAASAAQEILDRAKRHVEERIRKPFG